MTPNEPRILAIVVLALLMCQSIAFAKPELSKPHKSAYAMKVDFNPQTNQLTGLCQINGHPCWLQLDTGWVGVALYADRQADWNPGEPKYPTTQQHKRREVKGDTRVRALISLEPTNYLQRKIPVEIINDADQFRTSTGQPITGILGIPFLNVIPIEWNVPAHKIVFWLSGRPKTFMHVPQWAILRCKQDQYHLLIIPVSVRGRRGRVYFDTGMDGLYVFDDLISDFPAAGPGESVTGAELNFPVVPRKVIGLKIGPLTICGTVGGRLRRNSASDTLCPYGCMGMSIVSHLHLFVVGNRIIFDPHSRKFSSYQ